MPSNRPLQSTVPETVAAAAAGSNALAGTPLSEIPAGDLLFGDLPGAADIDAERQRAAAELAVEILHADIGGVPIEIETGIGDEGLPPKSQRGRLDRDAAGRCPRRISGSDRPIRPDFAGRCHQRSRTTGRRQQRRRHRRHRDSAPRKRPAALGIAVERKIACESLDAAPELAAILSSAMDLPASKRTSACPLTGGVLRPAIPRSSASTDVSDSATVSLPLPPIADKSPGVDSCRQSRWSRRPPSTARFAFIVPARRTVERWR